VVKERRRVQIVDFRGNKTVTNTNIEDALSEAFIRGQIKSGLAIEIGVKEGALWYWQEDQGGALSA